jgi:hypothetical protein
VSASRSGHIFCISCEEIDCIFEKGQVRKNMACFHAKEQVYKCITDSGRIAGLFPGFFSGKGGGLTTYCTMAAMCLFIENQILYTVTPRKKFGGSDNSLWTTSVPLSQRGWYLTEQLIVSSK